MANGLPANFLKNLQLAAGIIASTVVLGLLIYSAWSARVDNGVERTSNAIPKSQRRKLVELGASILLILLISAILVTLYQSFLLMYTGSEYIFESNSVNPSFWDIVRG